MVPRGERISNDPDLLDNKPHLHMYYGIPIVKKGEGLVGRGCGKKRKLYCNGVDRAVVLYKLQGYPTRKGADFLNRS